MEGLGAISLTTVPAFELPRYRITKRGALEPTEVLQVRRESGVYREGGFTKALEPVGRSASFDRHFLAIRRRLGLKSITEDDGGKQFPRRTRAGISESQDSVETRTLAVLNGVRVALIVLPPCAYWLKHSL